METCPRSGIRGPSMFAEDELAAGDQDAPHFPQRGQLVHFQRRIEPGERFDSGLVVMPHAETGADADLQYPSMRQRHDLGPLTAHHLDAAGGIDQVGQQRPFIPVGLHLPSRR